MEKKKPKTKEVTLEEFQQMPRSTPIVKATATVDVFDKNGEKKSTLTFTSEDLKDGT
jgi:hypothetical protein